MSQFLCVKGNNLMIRAKKEDYTDFTSYTNDLERYCDELEHKYSTILDDVHNYRYETQSMKLTIRNLCVHFGVSSEEELTQIYLERKKT